MSLARLGPGARPVALNSAAHVIVWLSHGLRWPGAVMGQVRLNRQFALLEVAVPAWLVSYCCDDQEDRMSTVVIGMDR